MIKFYFITGSQHLYGPETLRSVENNTKEMVSKLNLSGLIPYEIVWKPVVKTADDITNIINEANYDRECAGIITFMHTFSPSKMWINGLVNLSKPYCHFHTQFNREIPWEEIDMDFMNLNQSAHGDREHGFIGSRLRKHRKIVVGYWENEDVQKEIGDFMRCAAGIYYSKTLKVARFGDNMREVAVTEGDKVQAQIKLGWSVNYHPVGDLVEYINSVTKVDVDDILGEYSKKYTIASDDLDPIRYQAKIEAGMRKFLEEGNFGAFTTTFEDLHGLEQLPGLACQRLMESGYGFGAEGDWRTAAMLGIMKKMSDGLDGGTSFMEDYTYHLPEGNELVLGAHMLEVCPSIAKEKVEIRVSDLGIGGKKAPARMVFEGREGDAIQVSLVDMGGRLRLLINDVKAVSPVKPMPKLPVAKVMWKPLPDLKTAATAWLLSGGAHHTVMSYALGARHMLDFAQLMDIESVHINKDTDIDRLRRELDWNDIAYKLK